MLKQRHKSVNSIWASVAHKQFGISVAHCVCEKEWWMDRLEKGKDNGRSCMTWHTTMALLRAIDKFFEQKRKRKQLGQSFSNHFYCMSFLFIHFVLFLISSWLESVVILHITSIQLVSHASTIKSLTTP